MGISIVQGINNKPVSSSILATFFSNTPDVAGELVIGYPIIGTPEGPYPIDALLISPDRGIVIFDLIEGHDLGDYGTRQDDAANKLEARLKTHRSLMDKRVPLIPIYTVSFAPAMRNLKIHHRDGYALTNEENLAGEIGNFKWGNQRKDIYRVALSVIQNISTIRKIRGVKRTIKKEGSRGAKLKRLEDSISTLDSQQSRAVIETVEGVQRIRGLAGSGKTIILALKAAYLHAKHPEWRIAVTFNTRSLKGQFRHLIRTFSLDQTDEEPDWMNLRIVNAWGRPGPGERDGIYSEFCRIHGIEYHDFLEAKTRFGVGNEFAGACENAIGQVHEIQKIYDVILIDEAQDFSPAFLQLCYKMLGKEKRLVYAYDDLQNLTGASLPSPEEIFGKKKDGSPNVRFDNDAARRDIILNKCYRNSRPVLATAHALGFGMYRNPHEQGETGLVQMFEHPKLWEEVGYQVQSGHLSAGSSVRLRRTEDTSPKFLEEHSLIDDLIVFRTFDNEQEQTGWVTNEIKNNLTNEELRHDDIVVINTDPLTTHKKVGPTRRRLLELGINNHLAGIADPDIFFQQGSVAFTGIFRAKGNEAGMAYIINAEDCYAQSHNLASIRNRLFTAITRSKAWVRVLGIGPNMEKLIEEFMRLKEYNFELDFTYPTEEQRKKLRIIHRDMTEEKKKQLASKLEKSDKNLSELIHELESKNIYPEDLREDMVDKIKLLLKKLEK